MKKASKQVFLLGALLFITMSACSGRSSGHSMTIPDPVPGQTYVWDINATNGLVQWYDNSFMFIANMTFSSPGRISLDLNGQHQNDQTGTNVTGLVWYGNMSEWYYDSSDYVKNWTRENASMTEYGLALTLSVVNFPTIQWYGGFISQVNWAEIEVILGDLAKRKDGRLCITYSDTFQETYLEYDLGTGVLLHANTSAGDYHLEFTIQGYQPITLGGIPGYSILWIGLILIGCAVPLIAKQKRDRG
ncbi:hypothetical protein GF325_11310 [Candidatus Bathyarchaeota archaeon]|nr:hypothetical protein [Candidatus Bathyarchaeota archaeon]